MLNRSGIFGTGQPGPVAGAKVVVFWTVAAAEKRRERESEA